MLLRSKLFRLVSEIGSPSVQMSVSHWMSSYYCISMYLVAFMCYYFQMVYVQLRQNVSFSTQNGAVPLPAADLLAHAVSTPNNVKDIKKDWSLSPTAFEIATVFI